MFLERVTGLKDSTKNHYKQKLYDAMGILGEEPITALTPERLRAYMKQRQTETSDIQIRLELTALSSMCEWACDEELLQANPVRQVRRKRLGKAAKHSRKVRPTSLQLILDYLKETYPGFWFPFIQLVLETGMRHEEALGLSWDEVDLTRGIIHLESERTKTSTGRNIPIPDTCLGTLKGLPQYEWSRWVFTNPRTRDRYVSINKQWGRIRDKLGLPKVRIHDMRHSFASWTDAMGLASLDRRRIMGHSSEEVHMRYSSVDEQVLRKRLNDHSVGTYLAQETEFKSEADEKE
jgi:integrase